MHRSTTRPILLVLLAFACVSMLAFSTSNAAILVYVTSMDGPSESPPVPSPGVGSATVTFDTDAHTMHVQANFSGLVGTTTVAHIHAPTVNPFLLTASVATTTPSFVGWPVGVMAGAYDMVYDMTLASSYNASFITANGGTPASAELALIAYIDQGRAYFNVHSSFRTGGEIRGFLVPFTVPTQETTWGGIKALYR